MTTHSEFRVGRTTQIHFCYENWCCTKTTTYIFFSIKCGCVIYKCGKGSTGSTRLPATASYQSYHLVLYCRPSVILPNPQREAGSGNYLRISYSYCIYACCCVGCNTANHCLKPYFVSMVCRVYR